MRRDKIGGYQYGIINNEIIRTDLRYGHREHYPAAGVCEADQGRRCEKGTDQAGVEDYGMEGSEHQAEESAVQIRQ